MLLHVPDQIREAGALMITGTLVMDIPKGALNRIGLGAVGRQEEHLEAGMRRQPALDGLGLVNTVVVHDHPDLSELRRWVEPLQTVQQRPEQGVGLARARAMEEELISKLEKSANCLEK